MSPEVAVTLPWRDVFLSPQFKERLALIAVDEAHCIVEWLESCLFVLCIGCFTLHVYCTSRGKDFRKCFKEIGGLRALTDVPIMALTATAPEAMKASICSSLGLTEPVVISQTLDRPNIYFSTCKSKGLNVSMQLPVYWHKRINEGTFT